MSDGEKSLFSLRLTVTVIIAISAGAGIGTWLVVGLLCTVNQSDCDLANWQSLVLEGMMFGGGLGSFFYLLQRKNDKRIEKIIEDIDKRDNARRQFWLNVADSSLFTIGSDLKNLHSYYDVILNQTPNRERLDNLEQTMRLDKSRALNQTIVSLNMAVDHIADLLRDNSLITDVIFANFRWLLETADIRQPVKQIEKAMIIIDDEIKNI